MATLFDGAEKASTGKQYDLPSVRRDTRTHITPELMRAIMKIESGGDPRARTGSYKGLYQLSDKEFSRLGGRGDIFDPKENTRIAMLKLQQEADQVAAKLGRPLTPGEIYLVHQQGVGGSYAHLTNPDQPAWQNMNSTAEGRSKGANWSRLAIWGNVPDKEKARYGSVDKLTSGEFTKMWGDRVARGGGDTSAAVPTATPTPSPLDDPSGNTSGGDYATKAVAAAGTGGIGSDAARAPEQGALGDALTPPSKKNQDILGDTIADLGKGMADGPITRNAARASGPTNVPTTMATPMGVTPTVDPRMADMQRQQLAMALQRLNSRKLY